MTEVTVNADDLRAVLDHTSSWSLTNDDPVFDRLRAALPAEKPEPAHDPELREQFRRTLVTELSTMVNGVQAGWVLDALADEGYEVVRSEDIRPWSDKTGVKKWNAALARIAELEARISSQAVELAGRSGSIVGLKTAIKHKDARIAELEAERDGWQETADILADPDAVAAITAAEAESGGGDADDREVPQPGIPTVNLLTDQWGSPSHPPSADHFAPDDEGNTDYGGWFPSADDDDINTLRAQLAEKDAEIEALRTLPTMDKVLATFEQGTDPASGKASYRFPPGWWLHLTPAKVVVRATLATIKKLRQDGES